MILCSAEPRIISCLPTHVINLVINDNSLEILYIYIYIFDHLSIGDVLTFSRYTEYVVSETEIPIKKTSRQKLATQTLGLLNMPIKDLLWLSTALSGTTGVCVTERETLIK